MFTMTVPVVRHLQLGQTIWVRKSYSIISYIFNSAFVVLKNGIWEWTAEVVVGTVNSLSVRKPRAIRITAALITFAISELTFFDTTHLKLCIDLERSNQIVEAGNLPAITSQECPLKKIVTGYIFLFPEPPWCFIFTTITIKIQAHYLLQNFGINFWSQVNFFLFFCSNSKISSWPPLALLCSSPPADFPAACSSLAWESPLALAREFPSWAVFGSRQIHSD